MRRINIQRKKYTKEKIAGRKREGLKVKEKERITKGDWFNHDKFITYDMNKHTSLRVVHIHVHQFINMSLLKHNGLCRHDKQ